MLTLVNVKAPDNELVNAKFRTGDGVKYIHVPVDFIILFYYKIAFILFVMALDAVYISTTKLMI